MNFDFSDEQKEVKDMARKFLTEQCPTTVPREILENDAPYHADLWKGVVDMGWTATALPEEYGGIGFGYLELCVIAEEMGRAVAPVPFSSSVYLATEAILAGGSDAQKKNYLPKLASGEIIGTLAVSEGPQAPTPGNLKTTLDGGKVTGVKIPVADGDCADIAIVVANSGGDLSLSVVNLKGDGVTSETITTVDPTRSHARVTFDNAEAEVLDSVDARVALTKVMNRAAVLMAFEQIGGAEQCLKMARDYAIERYAFGRAIGSFQAIKHRLTDMYARIELARSNAYYGAWALSTDADELPMAAAGARISATEAYHFASKESIQIHGGMGFTWEHDCHFYYRRSKLLSLALGSDLQWKDRLVSHLQAAASA